MMYIIFVFGLLLVLIATLEMEYNVQIMFNYLNNTANCKFGNQCIYNNHYNLGDLQYKEQNPNNLRSNHGKVHNSCKD